MDNRSRARLKKGRRVGGAHSQNKKHSTLGETWDKGVRDLMANGWAEIGEFWLQKRENNARKTKGRVRVRWGPNQKKHCH